MKQLHQRLEWPHPPEFDSEDPYSILGVRKNASKETILKKHKQIAWEYHPDKLPNAMPIRLTFECITYFNYATGAKDLLIDENRRKMFDNYGHTGDKWENQNNILQEAKKALSQMFDSVVRSIDEHKAKNNDLCQVMLKVIIDSKLAKEKEGRKIKNSILGFEAAIPRLHSQEDNFVAIKAKETLEKLRLEQKNQVGSMMVLDKCAQLLKLYKYEFDKPTAIEVQRLDAIFRQTNTSFSFKI